MRCLGFCFIDITVVIGSYGIVELKLFTTFALHLVSISAIEISIILGNNNSIAAKRIC